MKINKEKIKSDINKDLENLKIRMEDLIGKGFYLEAFYLFSNILEYELKKAIYIQERYISVLLEKDRLRLEKKENLFSDLVLSKDHSLDLDNKMLGDLVKIFGKYCSDYKLVSDLHNINGFRKKIVHQLVKNDLNKINKNAKLFLINYDELLIRFTIYIFPSFDTMLPKNYLHNKRKRGEKNILKLKIIARKKTI